MREQCKRQVWFCTCHPCSSSRIFWVSTKVDFVLLRQEAHKYRNTFISKGRTRTNLISFWSCTVSWLYCQWIYIAFSEREISLLYQWSISTHLSHQRVRSYTIQSEREWSTSDKKYNPSYMPQLWKFHLSLSYLFWLLFFTKLCATTSFVLTTPQQQT